MEPGTLSREIERHTRVSTFPLGVKMLLAQDPLPEKAKLPERDFGHRVAVCQSYTIVRRTGWTIAVAREDVNCPLTKIAYGFDPPTPGYLSGELCCGMYTDSLDAGARTESQVPRFDPGRYRRILAYPLTRADRDPDVVLVYGNSAQVMLLLAASLYGRGGYLTCRFSPRIDCSDVRTMQTGEPQVILPCYGDRTIGGTEDHEMAFSFPWERAGEVVRGLEGLHRGGVRYPIPSLPGGEPRFPPKYVELDDRLRAARPPRGAVGPVDEASGEG